MEVLSKFGPAALQKPLCGGFIFLTGSEQSPFYMKLNFIGIEVFKRDYHA
jgi:hypothetical protein